MVCRFFVILFLIVTKGIYAPLLAGDLNAQQRSPKVKDFAPPQPMPPSSKPTNERNSETMKNSKKAYNDAEKELNRIISYVGFGILIAIFFMDVNFRVRKKCLVRFSSLFALLSLFLNYIGCIYLLKTSEGILSYPNDRDSRYSEMWGISDCLYWLTQAVLLLAVVLFCILGYQYFFYIEPNSKKKSRSIKS